MRMIFISRSARRLAGALTLLAVAAALPVSAQPKPYTIDVILALSGPAASLGADEAAGYAAYEKVVNRTGGLRGQPVHFQIYDDQSNPATAVALLGPILATHPAVVFGSTLAGPTQAMAPLVKNGPVLFAATPNLAPEKGGYVFAAGCLTQWYNVAALRYYSRRHMTRLATVTTTDASGQNNLAGLDAALALPETKGVQVVSRESFGIGDISMASQAAHIKAANAQVVFAYPNGTAFGTALHGLSDAGIDVPVYTSAANLNPTLLDRFKSLLPTELTSTAFSFFDRERKPGDPLKAPIDEFYDALGAAGIAQPTVAHMFAWDPARIVITALRQLGPNATATQLRDYILKMRHFAGVAGFYDFTIGDQHGLSQDSLLVTRWDPKAGRSVVVSVPGGAPLAR
jgi:branched-chain amino acid transport system substrate-binding protein